VDESAGQAGAPRIPHPEHRPPWCAECRHYDTDPLSPRGLLHRGPADTVDVYDEACHLVEAQVRVAF
jgi:hypothetical protein